MNNKKIGNAIYDILNLKGISIEYEGEILEINEFLISSEVANAHLLLFALAKMLRNGEVELNFTDKATDKNKNYIKKLLEKIEE